MKCPMRKLLPMLLVSAMTVTAASGCGVVYRQPIYQGNLLESTAVEQLQAGMSRQQVTTLLGTPSIRDPFNVDRWDYTASQRVGRLARTETKNLTLYFQGDSLVRWEGDYFPEQDEALAQDTIQQFGPNLAKEKNKKRGR